MGGLWRLKSRGFVVKSCHSHFQILTFFSGCSVEFSVAALDLPNLIFMLRVPFGIRNSLGIEGLDTQ